MKAKLCSAAILAGAVLTGTGHASAQEAAPPAPPAPNPAPAPSPAPPYTVGTGDSLSRISERRLGTGDRWLEIYVLNRDSIPDPDLIQAGQVLQIPSAPVPIPPEVLAALTSTPAARTGGNAAPRSRARTSAPAGATGGDLAAVRRCESGGNYGAVSANGQYRGAYQFDAGTWASVGGQGDPAAASPAEQDARAQQLQAQRGSSPWPVCG